MTTIALANVVELLDSGSEEDVLQALSLLRGLRQDVPLDGIRLQLVAGLAALVAGSERVPRPYFPIQRHTPNTAVEMSDYLTDTLWEELFRFTKDQFFNELLPILQLPSTFTKSGHTCEAALAILTLLARLSAPRPLSPDMVHWFLQDSSRISRFVDCAAEHIFARFHHTLCFDKARLQGELVGYATRVGWMVGIRDEVGMRAFDIGLFGDWKFQKVADLVEGNEDLFNADYGAPGFKYQFMTSPCGIIEDVSGPYGGATNDAEMARRSRLEERMGSFCNVPLAAGGSRRVKAYWDSAYVEGQYVERPHSRAIATPQELQHNKLMSGVRVSVEHVIGSVTQLFPLLDMTRYQRTGQSRVGLVFLVACIMRNFVTCVRGGNEVSDIFGSRPPSLDYFARPRDDVHPRVRELLTSCTA